jgi:HlyD family secretion protein
VRKNILCLIASILLSASFATLGDGQAVSGLGRLEPDGGIIHLAGPSDGCASGTVIKSLTVKEGAWVEKDEILAYLDCFSLREAEVARLQAIFVNANSEYERQKNLSLTSATSKVLLDQAAMGLDIAKADLAAAKARLDLAVVRAPLRAQILEIYASPGERVGLEGIMELGQTDRMYVVAEVYETDINLVKIGQTATVRIGAIDKALNGTVDRVALKVGRMDILGTDPVDKTDARVVEVHILLDKGEPVSEFTNMQAKVEIHI